MIPGGKIRLQKSNDQNEHHRELQHLKTAAIHIIQWRRNQMAKNECKRPSIICTHACGDQTQQFQLRLQHKNAHKREREDEAQLLVEVL